MRYRSVVADSARWEVFEHRAGDIVITTPPKCGTTWTQMLCALLIFDGPEFPAPLERLSPWLDMLNRPMDEVQSTYAGQAHRRFIKTHTPLDGLPLRDDVAYVVVGRDPRDVSISMEHHMANMDMDRFLELRTRAVGSDDLAELPQRTPPSGDPRERFRTFVEVDDLGGSATLATVLHHLSTGWERRSAPNVALFHYSDYQVDLPVEMVRLAAALGMEYADTRVAELAAEASLERMRERADDVVPSASLGLWRNTTGFLRAGASGQWRERATEEDMARYVQRVASLVPPDLAAWAHLGRLGSGGDPR
jgi:Sulfotransferase domain